MEEIKIGKVTFKISRTKSVVKLHGYSYDNTHVFFGRAKIVKPDNKSFFMVTRDLWRNGYIDEVRMLMKLAGYEISNNELEELYIKADQYVKNEEEKWKRIKRAWGIP